MSNNKEPSESSKQKLSSKKKSEQLVISEAILSNCTSQKRVKPSKKRKLQVFCRFRPISSSDTRSEYYDIINPNIVDKMEGHVKQNAPDNIIRQNGRVDTFTFNRVFDQNSSQSMVFEDIMCPVIEDLMDGKSGLVFTYGVTNAGKTFTMIGNMYSQLNKGIIPRSAELLLQIQNAVSEKESNTSTNNEQNDQSEIQSIQPDQKDELILQTSSKNSESLNKTEDSTKFEKNLDESFLYKKLDKKESEYYKHALANLQLNAQKDLSLELCETDDPNVQNRKYLLKKLVGVSQTMSIFEIYNEDIFDLLQDAESNNPPKIINGELVRNKLKLRETPDKKVIVEDLLASNIQDLEESLKKIEKSLEKRSVSNTSLNSVSSRSHTIVQFNLEQKQKVYLIDETYTKKVQEETPEDLQKDDPISVNNIQEEGFDESKFSLQVKETFLIDDSKKSQQQIIDLAGSERMKRTEASGNKQLEATKINNSLMVLGKCLEKLSKGEQCIPFRETKLTKLLSTYFSTPCNMAMITNINPRADDFDESLRVLNYASMAKEIKQMKSEIHFQMHSAPKPIAEKLPEIKSTPNVKKEPQDDPVSTNKSPNKNEEKLQKEESFSKKSLLDEKDSFMSATTADSSIKGLDGLLNISNTDDKCFPTPSNQKCMKMDLEDDMTLSTPYKSESSILAKRSRSKDNKFNNEVMVEVQYLKNLIHDTLVENKRILSTQAQMNAQILEEQKKILRILGPKSKNSGKKSIKKIYMKDLSMQTDYVQESQPQISIKCNLPRIEEDLEENREESPVNPMKNKSQFFSQPIFGGMNDNSSQNIFNDDLRKVSSEFSEEELIRIATQESLKEQKERALFKKKQLRQTVVYTNQLKENINDLNDENSELQGDFNMAMSQADNYFQTPK